MGPSVPGPGPQSTRNNFEKSYFLKRIISYLRVARTEPQIHANPCKSIPHPFRHVLGGVGRYEAWFYLDLCGLWVRTEQQEDMK